MSPSVAPLRLSTLVPNSRLIVKLFLEDHVPARHTTALPRLDFLSCPPSHSQSLAQRAGLPVGTLGPLGHHCQGNEHTWHLQNVCSVFTTVANNRSWINEWPILRDIDHFNGDLPGVSKLTNRNKHINCFSAAESCPTLCSPKNCSTPCFSILHQLPEFAQTHIHYFSDGIQPYHFPSPPSPSAFNLSQHQGIFQWSALPIR